MPAEWRVCPQRAEHLDAPCLHAPDCRFVLNKRRGQPPRPASSEEIARGYRGTCCDPWRSPNVRRAATKRDHRDRRSRRSGVEEFLSRREAPSPRAEHRQPAPRRTTGCGPRPVEQRQQLLVARELIEGALGITIASVVRDGCRSWRHGNAVAGQHGCITAFSPRPITVRARQTGRVNRRLRGRPSRLMGAPAFRSAELNEPSNGWSKTTGSEIELPKLLVEVSV